MSLLKRIVHPYLKWRYDLRSRKPYLYKLGGTEITVYPGVFSPKGTITTEVFAEYLLELDWRGKSVLELGAGSGILSFLLADAGANVTASDVSKAAIDGLLANNAHRERSIGVIHSDLFQNIDNQYETIILNPPFFAKNPTNEAEKAWFCGESFEFFKLLFEEFTKRTVYKETIYMILSTNAKIDRVIALAKENQLLVEQEVKLSRKGETHFVFRIKNK